MPFYQRDKISLKGKFCATRYQTQNLQVKSQVHYLLSYLAGLFQKQILLRNKEKLDMNWYHLDQEGKCGKGVNVVY